MTSDSSASRLPVLVAGAGPSGLVAALTLLQNHVPVRIIDKAPDYHISQRSNGVWPRTFEVFHFLRAHELHQKAIPIYPVREYKPGTLEPTKTFILTSDSHAPTPSVPFGKTCMFLGQPTIEGILRAHLEKHNCFVELETELQSFEDDGDRVRAKLAKKKDGEEATETFEASYLIGADGAKGVTWKLLGLTFLGETRQDSGAVVGDICLTVEGLDRDLDDTPEPHTCSTGTFLETGVPTCNLALRPADEIASDGYHMVLSMKDSEPKQLVADKKLIPSLISKSLGREANVRDIITLSHFRPNIRMVDKFGCGRVFVAGDAAHVHSPSGGQGLNSSVQDALNLAWKLSLVYKGFSPSVLMDSYNAERLPVIAEMLNITTVLLDKMQKAQTIESAMEREERLNMLGVNYRTSPIVVDEFTQAAPVAAYRTLDEGALVAGDRAPDAPALTGVAEAVETRLFDVFSATHHTLLAFTPDPASVADILEVPKRYPGDVIRGVVVLPEGSQGTRLDGVDVIVDGGGHAYRAYLAVKGEKKVVVVRPDGVVGAIVHGAEGVGTYFDKIFGKC